MSRCSQCLRASRRMSGRPRGRSSRAEPPAETPIVAAIAAADTGASLVGQRRPPAPTHSAKRGFAFQEEARGLAHRSRSQRKNERIAGAELAVAHAASVNVCKRLNSYCMSPLVTMASQMMVTRGTTSKCLRPFELPSLHE
jgi:hypothetical protein